MPIHHLLLMTISNDQIYRGTHAYVHATHFRYVSSESRDLLLAIHIVGWSRSFCWTLFLDNSARRHGSGQNYWLTVNKSASPLYWEDVFEHFDQLWEDLDKNNTLLKLLTVVRIYSAMAYDSGLHSTYAESLIKYLLNSHSTFYFILYLLVANDS